MAMYNNNIIKKAKRELFRSPLDSLITLILITAIGWASTNTIKWFITIADWKVVIGNIDLYIYGSFPSSEQWRNLLWIIILFALSILTLIVKRHNNLQRILPLLWILIVPLGIFLFSGGLGLTSITTRKWGGISLTLILTFCSLFIALPLGILLALARQSRMNIIRSSSRIYIDIMRSLPLIAVLFFGQLLIPLFLPIDYEINRFVRAVFAFGCFTAAYVAEDIRGGLQSIPPTQYEAAKVLGLNSKQILQLIILPQALRTALPALTNQAIGLLQNTSLMSILGLVELLGISRSILANPEFIGRYLEVYVWLATVYWFICTVMALLSKHIEQQLNPLNSSK